MKILILNVGSSSVKYEVFEKDKSVLNGMIERIQDKKGFSAAVKRIMNLLNDRKIDIDAIGHRVVHGGAIEKTCRITASTLSRLDKVKDLAPLHNIPELYTIRCCLRAFSKPQFAVFDTAFHSTMPEKASTYAIPYKLADKYGVRKYGFHGTSHAYVAHQACIQLGKDIKRQRIITCHLGNGCSITAIKNGKSIDTSMGMTPLEGLVMGTRCGDIDPGAIAYLMDKGYPKKQIMNILNHKSGLLGISGISNDLRDLLRSKSPRAKLAIEVFLYRIVKYIGAYNAVLGGTDILVFTGGIGENSTTIRNRILSQVNHLGIKNSLAIRTDEAKQMAREIMRLM